MAHFLAEIEGSRTPVSRLGTKGSGLRSVVASYAGSCKCYLWYDEKKKCDMLEVMLQPWHGSGCNVLIYYGPVDRYNPDPACRAANGGQRKK